MADFLDGRWTTDDGLTLHFRDYPGGKGKPPIVCLPGLTRNARDFAAVADRLAGAWRVLCVELRGRGESDYARDPASYVLPRYVADLESLFAQEGIDRFVAFGTSLGGLITAALAAQDSGRIAAALINDVGPELEPAGLDRIRGYVGQGRSFPTWMHAARALQESSGEVYPDWQVTDWLAQAKRVMTLGTGNRIIFDYDMKIAEPFAAAPAEAPDLWPMFEALAGRPVTLLRGELSDLLSAETAARLAERLPGSELVTVPRVGHPPLLTEPEAEAAIDRLLARVE